MLRINCLFLFLAVVGPVCSSFTPVPEGLTGAGACDNLEGQCKVDCRPQVSIGSGECDRFPQLDTEVSLHAPCVKTILVSPPNTHQMRASLLPVVELDEEDYATATPEDGHIPDRSDLLVHADEEDISVHEELRVNEEQSQLQSGPGEGSNSSNDTAPLCPLSHCSNRETINENQQTPHAPSVYSAWIDLDGTSDELLVINNYEPDVVNVTSEYHRANAVILMLARNSDLPGVLSTVKQVEDKFNKKFQYPYVFLNDDPFEERFKSLVTQLTGASVRFGVIPPEHLTQPSWINESRVVAAHEELAAQNVSYTDHVADCNMRRFISGFLYKHELLEPYRYYWRIEPHTELFCDIVYDPFLYMQDNDKVYGFAIASYEVPQTVTTLWEAVKEFMDANPGLITVDNAIDFVSEVDGLFYTYCHFWSNFEIADLEFWRKDTYPKFLDFLDQQGGFYYERWSDAAVHSIAVSLFARKDQIHFFDDIGYRHGPVKHCPQGDAHKKGKCRCDPADNFDDNIRSCLPRFQKLFRN